MLLTTQSYTVTSFMTGDCCRKEMPQSLTFKLANDAYAFILASVTQAGTGIYTNIIPVGEYSYLVNKVAVFQ